MYTIILFIIYSDKDYLIKYSSSVSFIAFLFINTFFKNSFHTIRFYNQIYLR